MYACSEQAKNIYHFKIEYRSEYTQTEITPEINCFASACTGWNYPKSKYSQNPRRHKKLSHQIWQVFGDGKRGSHLGNLTFARIVNWWHNNLSILGFHQISYWRGQIRPNDLWLDGSFIDSMMSSCHRECPLTSPDIIKYN